MFKYEDIFDPLETDPIIGKERDTKNFSYWSLG